ncbi:hypothetical protein BFJ63_vAg13083 [Fusarium oxysporum f. sp. narcissi]|uniref:Glyoxylate/succinic semialdehyde reductase 1 n=1 Tax=Fusarium oxysporum f. sp. narcissi TaxID=451672 RepID=A0A4Q2V9R9_FUSOX|nr:hypothetical protein BFJ63_vAg13083 [Fusarium oxysporum f. sp. narcissi]
MKVTLLSALLIVSASADAGTCTQDACLKAVGLSNCRARRWPPAHESDCSSFLRYTSIPSATTVTATGEQSTVTLKDTETLSPETDEATATQSDQTATTSITSDPVTVLIAVTPTKTVTVTTTPDPYLETDINTKTVVQTDVNTITETTYFGLPSKRAIAARSTKNILRPTDIPSYAASCTNVEQYSSACACIGVQETTIEGTGSIITETVELHPETVVDVYTETRPAVAITTTLPAKTRTVTVTLPGRRITETTTAGATTVSTSFTANQDTCSRPANMRIGFLGLGTMGTPMALNLRQQFPVTVWNRNGAKCTPLIEAGAKAAKTPSEVVEKSDVIFTMLFDGKAIQSMIDNEPDNSFMKAIRGKTLINTSSVHVAFSHKLAQQVQGAGGKFVEMPVSGSKGPAEQGQLVGMMAGDPEVAEQIRPVVKPITTAAIYCGPIGSGLKAKYSINLFLVSVTAGLAESVNLARAQGLDLEAFAQVVNSSPLASAYSRVKIAKILKGDWTPQAAIKDCYNSTELIKSAAQGVKVQTPLVQLCNSLYREAYQNGLGEEDMMAIYKMFAETPSRYAE